MARNNVFRFAKQQQQHHFRFQTKTPVATMYQIHPKMFGLCPERSARSNKMNNIHMLVTNNELIIKQQ